MSEGDAATLEFRKRDEIQVNDSAVAPIAAPSRNDEIVQAVFLIMQIAPRFGNPRRSQRDLPRPALSRFFLSTK